MHRLHRRNDRVIGEAWQVDRIDNLDMLDPPAAVASIGLGKILHSTYRVGIGSIAYRMHGRLEPVHRGSDHEVADFGAGKE